MIAENTTQSVSNDNDEVSKADVSLSDLATSLNVTEDALLERVARALAEREVSPDDRWNTTTLAITGQDQ